MGVSQLRAYEFIVGVEASAQPDAGTPSDPNDLVTLGYLSTSFAGRRKLVSSYASPTAVSAGTAIDPTIEADIDDYLMFIRGDGGPQVMSANPQFVAPGRAGIRLTLVGSMAANPTYTVTMNNGTGLAQNGPVEISDKTSAVWVSIDASTWQQEPTE